MIYYALGFCFCQDMSKVALIKKNSPEWQRGRFNGVGGKLEPGESPHETMEREFLEETGVSIPKEEWNYFHCLKSKDFKCYCYTSKSDKVLDVRTTTEEEIFLLGQKEINEVDKITNLTWLIPMAIDFLRNPGYFTSETNYVDKDLDVD